jgi:hypothetical protein
LPEGKSRARACLHVGVFDEPDHGAAPASLAPVVRRVLATIADLAAETTRDTEDLVAPASPLLRCIAPLQTGDERLVAIQALAAGYRLQVPLPATLSVGAEAQVEYDRLLSMAEVAVSIPSDANPAPAHRQALRDVVLDHSDILLIITESDDPESVSNLLRAARRRDLAVVAIAEHGPHDIRIMGGPDGADWSSRLRTVITGILDPFKAVPQSEQADIRALPLCYLDEGPAAIPWYARLNTWFERVMLIGWRAPPDRTAARATANVLVADAALAAAFSRLDALASRYAHFYRSAFVLRYLLIVPMAIGWCFGFFAATPGVRTMGFAVQWLAVIGTLGVTILARRTDWQSRFTAYRTLAERLRHQSYLAYFGRVLPTALSAAERRSPASVWIAWQFRSIVRQQGLGAMRREPIATQAMADALRAFLDEQRRFYRLSAARYAAIADRIWKTALWLFWADFLVITLRGFVIGVMRTLGWSADPTIGPLMDWWEDFLNEIDIVLPCLAWIILAVMDQSEYSRLAEQYAGMVDNAEAMIADLDRSEASHAALARIAINAAASLTSEVSRWRSLIASQDISYADM